MTIQVELSPETEARLAAQAAERSMDVPTYVAILLQQAAPPAALDSPDIISQPAWKRPAGRKSLAQLFAESPFRGLDLTFERERDFGRDIEL